jgi:tetratricopeptide (TPR) repeat protein
VALAEPFKQMYEWDPALAACQQALAYDARCPAVYAQLGEIDRLRSETLETDPGREAERQQFALLAVSEFRRSLELNPFQTEVQLRLALAHEQAGQTSEALQVYQEALLVDPHNAFSLLMVGLYCHRRGDDAQAVMYLKRSFELNAGDPVTQEYLRQIQSPSR